MTGDVDRIVDEYIHRLRRSMRGAAPQVIREAELEIRAHIEDALEEDAAADVGRSLDVLDRLGRPEDFGRDMALYLMVDRGYRDWSLPYMLRSTAFWALTTISGALVVMIFGALFAIAIGLGLAGLYRLLLPDNVFDAKPDASLGVILISLERFPGAVLLGLGLVSLVGLVLIVRWFVGQYVRHAGPQLAEGGDEGLDEDWARLTERRILYAAAAGFALTLVMGFGSGAYSLELEPNGVVRLPPPDFLSSPQALLSGAGLLVLALAPVVGVIWSWLADRNGHD